MPIGVPLSIVAHGERTCVVLMHLFPEEVEFKMEHIGKYEIWFRLNSDTTFSKVLYGILN